MNFEEMHVLSQHIDTRIKLLESKIASPMSMMYSNSNQGVKIMSMLKGMIENLETKKKEIVQMIQEENMSWSGMVEDFNTVDKYKSEVVANLNKYENIWSSTYGDYKPFISYGHGGSTNEELNSIFNGLDIQDDRQIADQYTGVDNTENVSLYRVIVLLPYLIRNNDKQSSKNSLLKVF